MWHISPTVRVLDILNVRILYIHVYIHNLLYRNLFTYYYFLYSLKNEVLTPTHIPKVMSFSYECVCVCVLGGWGAPVDDHYCHT